MQNITTRNITWEAIKDWEQLPHTLENKWHQFFVSEEDIDTFIQKKLSLLADEMGISYEELFPIFQENNAEFYAKKKKIFKTYLGLPQTGSQLYELGLLLKMPVFAK